jgi:LysM repeat protein
MVGRSARFLAPLALAAVAVGIYLIVHSTIAKPTGAPTTSSQTVINARRHGGRTHRRTPRFYRVKSGDTLSRISEKTGVPVATLTSLNPVLSSAPNSLQIGQRLRLRR